MLPSHRHSSFIVAASALTTIHRPQPKRSLPVIFLLATSLDGLDSRSSEDREQPSTSHTRRVIRCAERIRIDLLGNVRAEQLGDMVSRIRERGPTQTMAMPVFEA